MTQVFYLGEAEVEKLCHRGRNHLSHRGGERASLWYTISPKGGVAARSLKIRPFATDVSDAFRGAPNFDPRYLSAYYYAAHSTSTRATYLRTTGWR